MNSDTVAHTCMIVHVDAPAALGVVTSHTRFRTCSLPVLYTLTFCMATQVTNMHWLHVTNGPSPPPGN